MFRQIVIAGFIAAGAVGSPVAFAAEPAQPAAAAAAYSTANTSIGDLLDNPATKAVLEKHIAQFVDNPQIDMARGMTLRQIQSFAGDVLTDEVLARIDADLAKVPGTK